MSSALKGTSDIFIQKNEFSPSLKIGILVSEWNSEVTNALKNGAINLLSQYGISESQIILISVPGSFELSLASQFLCEKQEIEGVIALGCVIQGETKHFDYVCQGVTYGLTEVSLKYNKPVIFGVLTTLTQTQALERAGGKFGNKGEESALTLLKMISIKKKLS